MSGVMILAEAMWLVMVVAVSVVTTVTSSPAPVMREVSVAGIWSEVMMPRVR